MRAELEGADVLAMPCVVARDGDRDSMPVVVKEAMAMGLLVVASDEVGLPECVLAPWGFLAPPGDADALAAQLRAALALDAGRQRRAAGAQARAWVQANADVDVETARMASVHRGAPGGCGSGSGGTSTRRRGLSAIVRQPALIAQRCSRVFCGG